MCELLWEVSGVGGQPAPLTPAPVCSQEGLSAPVPRGRKGKKKQREAKLVAQYMEESDWSKDKRYNSEVRPTLAAGCESLGDFHSNFSFKL